MSDFLDQIYVATPEQVKYSLYCLLAANGPYNIDDNVDFLYNLLTLQGVTL